MPTIGDFSAWPAGAAGSTAAATAAGAATADESVTNVQTAVGKAGVKGTLAASLQGIADQQGRRLIEFDVAGRLSSAQDIVVHAG